MQNWRCEHAIFCVVCVIYDFFKFIHSNYAQLSTAFAFGVPGSVQYLVGHGTCMRHSTGCFLFRVQSHDSGFGA